MRQVAPCPAKRGQATGPSVRWAEDCLKTGAGRKQILRWALTRERPESNVRGTLMIRRIVHRVGWRYRAPGWGLALVFAVSLAAQDQTPPYLVSVTPPAQSIGVATTQEVTLVFSEPMLTAPAALDLRMVAAFPAAGPLPFAPSWSGDRRTLSCRPLPAWPPGTTVLWNVGSGFMDTVGNRLATNVVGGFTTAYGSPSGPGTGTNQVTEFRLARWDRYRQVDAGPPVLDVPLAAQFEAVAVLASNRTAVDVTLITPALATLPLLRSEVAPEYFTLSETSADPAQLAVRFTGGSYRFRLDDSAGQSQALLFFPLIQPPVPKVSDWATTRGMEADEPWTLEWEPWVGATADDTIEIVVGDGLLRTPAPGEPGALPGSATSWVVPAGTLASRAVYEVTLLFSRVETMNNPEKLEFTSVRRTTSTTFEIQTAPLPGDQFVLSMPIRLGRQLEFELAGPPDTVVVLETNPAWADAAWEVVLATNSGLGWVTFRVPWDEAAPAGLIRARTLGD